MNVQAEETTSVVDIVKWVFSTVFLVSGIAAFYYFSDFQLLYRVLGLVGVFFVAIVICFNTCKGRAVWVFAQESKQEFKRVVWPTRDEAVRTTLLVFLMVFLVGLILWLLDMFLFWGVQLLMNQGIK